MGVGNRNYVLETKEKEFYLTFIKYILYAQHRKSLYFYVILINTLIL